jgi:hypothetical protein
MRFGSAGEPFTWYISQPPKCGPLTRQSRRLPSDSKMKAPLRVPTRTRTKLMMKAALLRPKAGAAYQQGGCTE